MAGPSLYIQSLRMNALELKSGQSTTGTIIFDGAANADTTILLSTDTVGADVPVSVAVTASDTFASFTLNTSGLRANTVIRVSAHYYGQTHIALIRIIPANLGGMFFSAPTVTGGDTVDLTIELDTTDNVGGVTVLLSQSTQLGNYAPLFVDLPDAFTIAAGLTSDTFTLTTRQVTRNLSASVSAAYSQQTATASILITVT